MKKPKKTKYSTPLMDYLSYKPSLQEYVKSLYKNGYKILLHQELSPKNINYLILKSSKYQNLFILIKMKISPFLYTKIKLIKLFKLEKKKIKFKKITTLIKKIPKKALKIPKKKMIKKLPKEEKKEKILLSLKKKIYLSWIGKLILEMLYLLTLIISILLKKIYFQLFKLKSNENFFQNL